MLGFVAHAISTELNLDHDEIAEARWVTRPELAKITESGELRLPGQVSIARRLIETWYGASLPGDW
jgi:NAD+ diphosphatase